MSASILVVEDEAVIRKVLDRFLTKLGYRLCLAASLREASENLNAFQADLLITDLRLPDGDGVEMVRRFEQAFPNAKSIIITGAPPPEERLEEIRKGSVADI